MVKEFTPEDDALLDALGAQVEAKKTAKLSPKEERIIAGFEDIQRFFEEHQRLPHDRDGNDIFERLYAVRLEQIAKSQECLNLIEGLDHQGLLKSLGNVALPDLEELDDDALLEQLGVAEAVPEIATLKHVRTRAEKKPAEEVANRKRCEDFESFKPLFVQMQEDLNSKKRETRKFELKSEIEQGRFFIVKGQIAYVAEKGETTITDHGRTDARLRVIFDNGTESDLLMRSLQRALNADKAGRRITDPVAGPLFSGVADEGDRVSGTIYVLRSKSSDPYIDQNRDLVHKIGVTTNPIEQRISGAHLQPTFLMAPVEVVATYDVYDINPTKLENLIHRVFKNAKLEIEIGDRMGRPIKPREWFLVPLVAIQEAVQHIINGTIQDQFYDPNTASFQNSA